MLDFQTEHLHTFLAVLECGTFDAAATQLHVSASAVSQRIKAMEQSAGILLLTRTTPIQATAAGFTVHRLARQLRQLEADCAAELGLSGTPGSTIAVAVNADSLATWFIDALVAVPTGARLTFEVLREDEQHSARLLRSGEVMAAVTATADPVQGCSVVPLGALEYRAVATASFLRTWLPDGFVVGRLGNCPMIQFDRTDTLQTNFFEAVSGEHFAGPRHFIPDSIQFARAVKQGLGWGLLPESHCRTELESGVLVELVPGEKTYTPLYWQHWKIQSVALDSLTRAVIATASAALA